MFGESIEQIKNKVIYYKNFLNRKISVEVIDGSLLTNEWKQVPLVGNYLQCRFHNKYADSGIEISLNHMGTEIILISDGMKYNRAFDTLWIRSNGIGNSSKIYLYAGWFENQIEQNTQVQLSRIVEKEKTLIQDATYTQDIFTNSKKAYINISAAVAGVNNYDLVIIKTYVTGVTSYVINDLDFSNTILQFEIDTIGIKKLTVTLINRFAGSMTLNIQYTME